LNKEAKGTSSYQL